ncbi:MAG: HEAT repeat domain-containing protein [Armatimonadetes bacterium]|nr:HEAT repeat domain-containing protein [Armatimonadota bacterium]
MEELTTLLQRMAEEKVLDKVSSAIRDSDSSVRRKALDLLESLLYSMPEPYLATLGFLVNLSTAPEPDIRNRAGEIMNRWVAAIRGRAGRAEKAGVIKGGGTEKEPSPVFESVIREAIEGDGLLASQIEKEVPLQTAGLLLETLRTQDQPALILEACKLLEEAMQRDEEIRTMVGSSSPTVSSVLVQKWMRHDDAGVRHRVVGFLESAQWWPDALDDKVCYLVVKREKSLAEGAWNEALENKTLAALREPACRQILLGALKDISWVSLRGACVEILGLFRAPDVVSLLEKCLPAEGWMVRDKICQALGEIGHKGSEKSLRECLNDSDASVRLSAAQALRRLGWSPESEEEEIRFAVASRNWGGIASPTKTGLLQLCRILGDRDPVIRREAASALVELKHPETVPVLLEYLKEEKWWVWKPELVSLLGRFSDSRATEFLVGLLKKETGDVKRAAIAALGEIGDRKAVSALTAQLRRSVETLVQAPLEKEETAGHSHWEQATSLLEAVSRTGSRAAAPILREIAGRNLALPHFAQIQADYESAGTKADALGTWAGALGKNVGQDFWHFQLLAFSALVRIDPKEARNLASFGLNSRKLPSRVTRKTV